MVLNKGGYVMINKAQDNVYELATSALTSGKPILWYESNNECYYIDTITKSGTDIILTKGGKTITIESDGDITEVGEVQQHLYEYIISSNDYGFIIQLPFKLKDNYSIGTLDDITSNFEEDIFKLTDIYNNGNCGYSYSESDGDTITSTSIIRTTTDISILIYYTDIDENSEVSGSIRLTYDSDKHITAFNSSDLGDLDIYYKRQIF